MALLLIMPIALQFTVWGFSFQARGYELQLLCCWIAFITVFKYAQNGGTRLLRINTFCCIAGFILVPTFLYYYLTQLAFFVCVQFINRRLDWAFWRYQAFWLVAVFLCYTPGFCFSGYSAFTGNLYVKEAFPNVGAFWPVFTDVTTYFFNFCYSCIISEGHPVNYVAVALPLLLFFLPEKNHKLLGLFYVLLWMVYAIVVLYMKRVPFNRNMILHYSLTMAASLYTFYVLIALIGRKLRANPAKMGLWAVCFVAPALLFSYHLFREDRKNVSLNLYFYDLNTLHDSMMRHISSLPPGSTVGCSDEGFYWYYYGKKNKYKTTSCPTGNEGYYVKRANEPLPPTFENKYVFEKKAYDNYEVYKKK